MHPYYKLIRDFLFLLPPEFSHTFALKLLPWFLRLQTITFPSTKTVTVMGLTFPNSIGLAAGLDKNGDHINALQQLGFGHIEIGTLTPKSQLGNPKPRLFRLKNDQALINRMGFNNKGIDYLVARLAQIKLSTMLGINIGKNASTPLERTIQDYEYCYCKAYPYANYITVNISSPNTQGLRTFQYDSHLKYLLEHLLTLKIQLEKKHEKIVPLVIKIAPDLEFYQIINMSKTFNEYAIDGVIATNTTIQRNNLSDKKFSHEQGGLSGKPLTHLATAVLKEFKLHLHKNIALIASGGIMSASDAQEKIAAGADLVQIYTGLIYQGPALIKDILNL